MYWLPEDLLEQSLPVRERGLKSASSGQCSQLPLSLPVRERGLKSPYEDLPPVEPLSLAGLIQYFHGDRRSF